MKILCMYLKLFCLKKKKILLCACTLVYLYSLIDCVTNNRVRLVQQSGLKIIDGPPPEYVSIIIQYMYITCRPRVWF